MKTEGKSCEDKGCVNCGKRPCNVIDKCIRRMTMGKTKIEWCDYTINPYIGCKHGCLYCYAERMNERFRFVKKWDEPEYQALWLHKIDAIKKPSIIFMGSMTDLFGEWVETEEIQDILLHCGHYNQHKFLFLTKNPKRYKSLIFPENCWKGITITRKEMLPEFKGEKIDFVSIEPLLDYFNFPVWASLKWVIVGGLTPKPVLNEATDTMVKDLIHTCHKFVTPKIPIFLKDNLHYPKVIKEYPAELRKLKGG